MTRLSTVAPQTIRMRAGRGIALLALLTSLAGCWSSPQHAVVEEDYPNDVRLRHPIGIREANRTLDLFIGVDRGGLTTAQRAQVAGFAAEWRREGTGGMVIDLPERTPNARAAAEALHEVRSILAATGVPARAVVVRPFQPGDPIKLATLRLNYPRMTAEVGPCGLWPHDIGPTAESGDFSNRQYWNFGCAYQRNVAAMVEDPADLVQPREETPAYASRRSIVLDKYRKGENTATVDPNADKGKISDLGK